MRPPLPCEILYEILCEILCEALARTNENYARVNPRHARAFTQARGHLAKTDRVDAKPRDDLVGAIRAEKNRLLQARDAWIRIEIRHIIKALEASGLRVEAESAALVDNNTDLRSQSCRLCTMPGIGPTISAAIRALAFREIPELGQRTRRQSASLAGLAPHACESGLHRSKRCICGGRSGLCRVRYLAAIIAPRHDPRIKALRQHLQAAGKLVKLAITACALKLLAVLNAMIKDDIDYIPRKP